MNCNEYLLMLETLPVDELAYGHAREHVSQCRDCDRVTRVVAERERNMRLAFDDLHSSIPVAQTAVWAIESSRRRRVARYYEVALGIAMAASLVYLVMSRRVVPTPVPTVSETFRLQCLSPEQAAEVLRPYRSPAGSISLPPGTLAIINVRAPLEEIQKMRWVLGLYDNPTQAQCAAQVIVPRTP